MTVDFTKKEGMDTLPTADDILAVAALLQSVDIEDTGRGAFVTQALWIFRLYSDQFRRPHPPVVLSPDQQDDGA